MKPILTAIATLSCLSLSATAQQEQPAAKAEISAEKSQILVQTEMIQLETLVLNDWLFGANINKSGLALRTELQDMIKAKKATLIESTLLTCTNREQARNEAVKQMIYPTEYDPAEITPEQTNKKGVTTKATATGPTPTSFEERPVGTILECLATINPTTQVIQLKIDLEKVDFTGNTTWGTWKDANGESNVVMPNFYKLAVKSTFHLKNNQYHLAAILSPKDKDGKMDTTKKIVVFVRAAALNLSK